MFDTTDLHYKLLATALTLLGILCMSAGVEEEVANLIDVDGEWLQRILGWLQTEE